LCLDIARPKAADRFVHEALALCKRLGERHGIARCLNLLGYLTWARGNLSVACDLHRRSLTLNRELDDRWGTAWALHRLSMTLLHLAEQGQVEASSVRPLIEEGLAIWQELGERRHFAFALSDLAHAATLEGDFERARRCFAESHAIFAELADQSGVCWVLAGYGFLLATQGHQEAALCAYAAAITAFAPDGRGLVPFQQLRFERQQQLGRDVLGADAAARAWADGQRMSLPEAIARVQLASAAAPAEGVSSR